MAVEVLPGEAAGAGTVAAQVAEFHDRLGLPVVLVGDRGDAHRPAHPRGPASRGGPPSGHRAPLHRPPRFGRGRRGEPQALRPAELGRVLFRPLPGGPSGGLPQLPARRGAPPQARNLLPAIEKRLEAIATAARRERRPLRGAARIRKRVGVLVGPLEVEEHFLTETTGASFAVRRNAIAPRESAGPPTARHSNPW